MTAEEELKAVKARLEAIYYAKETLAKAEKWLADVNAHGKKKVVDKIAEPGKPERWHLEGKVWRLSITLKGRTDSWSRDEIEGTIEIPFAVIQQDAVNRVIHARRALVTAEGMK